MHKFRHSPRCLPEFQDGAQCLPVKQYPVLLPANDWKGARCEQGWVRSWRRVVASHFEEASSRCPLNTKSLPFCTGGFTIWHAFCRETSSQMWKSFPQPIGHQGVFPLQWKYPPRVGDLWAKWSFSWRLMKETSRSQLTGKPGKIIFLDCIWGPDLRFSLGSFCKDAFGSYRSKTDKLWVALWGHADGVGSPGEREERALLGPTDSRYSHPATHWASLWAASSYRHSWASVKALDSQSSNNFKHHGASSDNSL